jgi:hypothetical protein
MKQLLDLDTFAKTLTYKGYDGYFQTQGAYSGKIKESISSFLEACKNGMDKPMLPNILMLNAYLQWNGEDKPKVQCSMWVKYENGLFDVEKMDIERKDQYGHSLKKYELKNLTTGSVPASEEAIAQVSEKLNEELSSRKRGFRM